VWATGLELETLLDLVDSGLECGDLVLQLGEITLENLPPTSLAGGSRLDPAQRLRDRLVLLLEPLEAAINLVEVPEHVLTQPGDLMFQCIKATVDRREATVDGRELLPQELDQLRVFGRRHGPYLPHLLILFKCVRMQTESERVG
jgi:hypothetical protein